MASEQEILKELFYRYDVTLSEVGTKLRFTGDSIEKIPILTANYIAPYGTLESQRVTVVKNIIERGKEDTADSIFQITQEICLLGGYMQVSEIPDYFMEQHREKVRWSRRHLYILRVFSPYQVEFRSELENAAEQLGVQMKKG